MQEGILTAADAVKRETGVEKINVVGYCVGGTLLATTLAYLAARGEEPFTSASFLATQVDFTHAGDLLLFTDADQLEALERADVGARLPRRLAHGERVQHAAPARPHLALHRQQLPAWARSRSRSTCSTGTRIRRA